MVTCYRDTAHQSPNQARFCVECGVPLRQACPYDSSHLIVVKDEKGHSPRRCPECGRSLKACVDCGRLHQLADAACRTRACRARPLLPPNPGWPVFGGSLSRRGAYRIGTAPTYATAGAKVWDLPPLPGERATAVSAYDELYLAVESRLYLTSPGSGLQLWKAADLQARVGATPGALEAAAGFVFTLTEAGAWMHSADHLHPARPLLRGEFGSQVVWQDHWLLYGRPEGEPEAGLYRLSLDRPSAGLTRLDGAPTLATLPPVECGGSLYWFGKEGEILRYDGHQIALADRVHGPVIAAAATDAERVNPGLVLLTRQEIAHRLHFLDITRPNSLRDHPIQQDGLLLPRLWTAGSHVFVARKGGFNGGSPEVLQFDCRTHSPTAQRKSWPAGWELIDMFLVQAPDCLDLELGLRDPGLDALSLHRERWPDGHRRDLGRYLGLSTATLLQHAGLTVTVAAVRRLDQRQICVSAFPLEGA